MWGRGASATTPAPRLPTKSAVHPRLKRGGRLAMPLGGPPTAACPPVTFEGFATGPDCAISAGGRHLTFAGSGPIRHRPERVAVPVAALLHHARGCRTAQGCGSSARAGHDHPGTVHDSEFLPVGRSCRGALTCLCAGQPIGHSRVHRPLRGAVDGSWRSLRRHPRHHDHRSSGTVRGHRRVG